MRQAELLAPHPAASAGRHSASSGRARSPASHQRALQCAQLRAHPVSCISVYWYCVRLTVRVSIWMSCAGLHEHRQAGDARPPEAADPHQPPPSPRQPSRSRSGFSAILIYEPPRCSAVGLMRAGADERLSSVHHRRVIARDHLRHLRLLALLHGAEGNIRLARIGNDDDQQAGILLPARNPLGHPAHTATTVATRVSRADHQHQPAGDRKATFQRCADTPHRQRLEPGAPNTRWNPARTMPPAPPASAASRAHHRRQCQRHHGARRSPKPPATA